MAQPNLVLWATVGISAVVGLVLVSLLIFSIYTLLTAKPKLGLKCNSDAQCGEGLVCVNNVCVKPKPEGQACMVNKECEGDLICLANQKCGKPSQPSTKTEPTPDKDRPASIPRGVGYFSKSACLEKHKKCEKFMELFYKKCPKGYSGVGPVCWKA